ncbi:MAG TPA: protein kinase [Gemmatimonadaceae bacterium]|nr:protein kinase [Gemmatimonadaceae bacterium]
MRTVPLLNSALSGHYHVDREIGAGGMATVYLARDLRHNRDVALKVLNPELGAVLAAHRFLSEIHVTARLQHPNIVPLFDSGDADGLLFYVMPYIPGETLRSRLTREKQLPIDETIRLATAIASAVDYAHRSGVVHRDLKPENILLHEGQPLVADFGIALAVTAAADARITQTGLSLGTPQYMSPEQATGDRVIDQRTDVYSLGAVVYEMLTGEPPHTGTTSGAIIARILTEQPRSIRATRPTVSKDVEAAVLRALEKTPADRWQTARAFADALAARARAIGAMTGGVTGALHLLSRPATIIAAALILGGLILTWLTRQRSDASSLTFVIEPPMVNGVRQHVGDFALSPDGRMLALVAASDSGSQVFLRRLSEPNATPVSGTELASFVAFSPDGQWLAVATFEGKLLKVRVDGSATLITLAEGIDWYSGVEWVDNQTMVLGSSRPARRGLGRLAATGGTIRPVTTTEDSLRAHAFPYLAADRNTLLFTEWGPGFTEDDFLAIGSLETGAYHTTPLRAARPVGIVGHHAVYTVGATIMAVPFDAKRLRLSGDPVRVLEDVSFSNTRSVHLSSSGTLAYIRGQVSKRLVLLESDARTQTISGDEHTIWSIGRFSPDGRRIALDVWTPSGDTSITDIWTFDVRTRTFTRVTSLGNVIEPDWTSDGNALLFTTWFPRNAAIWRQVADGSEPAERLLEVPNGVALFQATATPDGRGVVFCQGSRFMAADLVEELFYLPFQGSRTPEKLVDEPMGSFCGGRVSPDGRWLAYTAVEGGRPNVFVRRFRSGGGRVKVSEGNGVYPVWSRDGARLFYAHVAAQGGRRWAVAASLRASGNTLEVVTRESLVPLPQTRAFDVAPDDERILVPQPSTDRIQLMVTTNWLPSLRARVAGRVRGD